MAVLLFKFLLTAMICEAKYIEVQGHRGARGVMMENSLPSFEAAIEAGADQLELDLVVTQDGELLIFHDFFINPDICVYSDGSAISSAGPLIYSLPLSEVKRFECKPDPLFPRQPSLKEIYIPTLQELFTMIANSSHPHAKKVCLNLEIKRDPEHPEFTPLPEVLARKVLELVKKNEFSDRVYYSSFDSDVLAELRKLEPKITLGFLRDCDLQDFTEKALELKANILSPEHILIQNAEFVHSLKQLGFKVIVWTVNDPYRALELIHMGVDGLITDYPKEMIQFLERNNLRTKF